MAVLLHSPRPIMKHLSLTKHEVEILESTLEDVLFDLRAVEGHEPQTIEDYAEVRRIHVKIRALDSVLTNLRAPD